MEEPMSLSDVKNCDCGEQLNSNYRWLIKGRVRCQKCFTAHVKGLEIPVTEPTCLHWDSPAAGVDGKCMHHRAGDLEFFA